MQLQLIEPRWARARVTQLAVFPWIPNVTATGCCHLHNVERQERVEPEQRLAYLPPIPITYLTTLLNIEEGNVYVRKVRNLRILSRIDPSKSLEQRC